MFKFLRLAAFLLGAIMSAETKFGVGKGADKKRDVVERLTDDPVSKTELMAGGIDLTELFAAVEKLIDAVVALLNLLGVFEKAAP